MRSHLLCVGRVGAVGRVAFDRNCTGGERAELQADFSGVVSGFNGDDHLDLLDVAFGAGTTASYVANQAGTGGTLSVTDGVHTANIALLGQYDPAGFQTKTRERSSATTISISSNASLRFEMDRGLTLRSRFSFTEASVRLRAPLGEVRCFKPCGLP
jgi:hypothetical protein